jgi:hypothetical protein
VRPDRFICLQYQRFDPRAPGMFAARSTYMTMGSGRGNRGQGMAQDSRKMGPPVGQGSSIVAWISLVLGILIYIVAAVLA